MVVVLVLLIAVAATNPGKEAHQEKIITKFKQEHPYLGLLFGGEAFSKIVGYKNYVFFSKAKIHNKTLSVGYFTKVKVYTTKVAILKNLLQPSLQKQLKKMRQNE